LAGFLFCGTMKIMAKKEPFRDDEIGHHILRNKKQSYENAMDKEVKALLPAPMDPDLPEPEWDAGLPLAEDPDYVLPPWERIKAKLDQKTRNRCPKLRPVQYWALELLIDYAVKDLSPNLSKIADKIGRSHRTMRDWFNFDPNFYRAMEFCCMAIGESMITFNLARTAARNMMPGADQDRAFAWRMELTTRWLQKIKPPLPPERDTDEEAVQIIDEDTGEALFLTGQEARDYLAAHPPPKKY